MGIKLSILDQSVVFPGETAYDAFRHTIELVQKAESWIITDSGFLSIMIPSRLPVHHPKY